VGNLSNSAHRQQRNEMPIEMNFKFKTKDMVEMFTDKDVDDSIIKRFKAFIHANLDAYGHELIQTMWDEFLDENVLIKVRLALCPEPGPRP
jgi:hypothetical protein